jgi:two-component system cell cycle sensor histidine kinase/response regulator CckA
VAARRAEELARQLHVYSGEGEPVLEPISLSDLVREMAPLFTAALPRRVTLDLQLEEDLPQVDADPLLLPQVVTNLVVNASEAIGDVAGTVTIRTSVRPFDPEGHPVDDLGRTLRRGSYVGLDICDTGVGMDDDTRARLFDPFFTTKGTGRGLGLAAVRGIVLEHGAPIHVSSARGAGSTVAISFLVSAAAAVDPGEPAARAPRAEAHGTGMILVVDDEEPVLRLARMTLERAGFSVVTATDGIDALEVFNRHAGEIRAVVLDLMMPRMDGAATLRELHRLRGDLPIILSSGFIAQKAAQQFTAGSLAGMIQKPYVGSQLVAAVCQALAEGPGRIMA